MMQSRQSASDKSPDSPEASDAEASQLRRKSVTFADGTNGEIPTHKDSINHSTNEQISTPHASPQDMSRESNPGKHRPIVSQQQSLGFAIRNQVFQPEDESLESFLPRDNLDKSLTQQRIIEALQTEGGFPPERLESIARDIIDPLGFMTSSQPHLRSRKEIFAILSLIDKISTIESFIQDGLFDHDLPFRYLRQTDSLDGSTRPWVMKTCDLHKESREIPFFRKWSNKDAELFEGRQCKVHIPVFTGIPETTDKPTHYLLAKKANLPYISKTEVGRGGFGAVDRVEIHASHAITSGNSAVVAVKRLGTSERCVFDREVSNLNRFATKDAPHLIQLLWTFSLGSEYHLVFPCADGNLMDLWRQHHTPLAAGHDHETALWFSRQCLGIAEGLDMIHRTNGRDSDELQKYGRHGDLKPENILWFRNPSSMGPGYSLGTLKISDFGLTRFHRTQTKSHINTDGIGGSPTYRAPEYDVHDEVAQSYDIWCLACVLLEFTTWYLNGWAAVDKFAESRKNEDSNHRMKEDTFFNHVHQGNIVSAVAKKTVAAEMRSLYEHSDASDLTVDLLEFVETDLLRMHPGLRKKCDQVMQQLRRIFDNSCRNRNYCLKLTRDTPVRKDTDLSRLDPVGVTIQFHTGGLRSDDILPQLRQGRGSGSSSPRLSLFRLSNPQVDTLFEEPVSVDYVVQKGMTNGQLQQPIESQNKPHSSSHVPDAINNATPNDNSGKIETTGETVDLRTTEQEDHGQVYGQPEQMMDAAGPSTKSQDPPVSSTDVQLERKKHRSRRRDKVMSKLEWVFCFRSR
ncbi:hypothetical protein HYE68_003954 [Fusarium pseudograminearum]|nr:hypothetical protein HYE68_003954 [Fusarium pseudograminearum]